MKSERLFRILGLVDDDLIADVDRPMQRNARTAWRPWAAAAACLVVLCGVGLLGQRMGDSTGDAAGSTGETPRVSFTFHRNTDDDFSQLTLTLYAWDTSSCLASLTGEGSRLVDRSAVNDLVEQLQTLFAE